MQSRDFSPARRSIDPDILFSPFEVVDMGNGKVAVNMGKMIVGAENVALNTGHFTSTAKPQDLLGEEVDESLLLTVETGKYVCLVVNDIDSSSPNAQIVCVPEAETNQGDKCIKLAKIREIKNGEGDEPTKYIDIEDYWYGNIVASTSSGVSSYIPWKPNFFTEGTEETPIYKIRFNLGTVNNVCADEWDKEFTIGESDVRFVILEVSSESTTGKVQNIEITLSASSIEEDYVTPDTPPPLHKILLGVVDKSSGKMIETKNLNISAVEVYRASKESTPVGEEAFTRYWRWKHEEV